MNPLEELLAMRRSRTEQTHQLAAENDRLRRQLGMPTLALMDRTCARCHIEFTTVSGRKNHARVCGKERPSTLIDRRRERAA